MYEKIKLKSKSQKSNGRSNHDMTITDQILFLKFQKSIFLTRKETFKNQFEG